MNDFIFDLQRFATQTIAAGESVTIDGVTYTALDGQATLNLDDDGKVSGIESGSVTATVTNAKNSSTLTLDATNGSTDFTLTGNGEVLTLTKVLPFELDNGTFTLAGNVLTAAKGSDLRIGSGRTYADGTTVFGHDYADTDITYTITETTLTEETERETITFTARLGDLARSITDFVSGKIINGVADGKFTGGFTITKGSSMGLTLGDYTIKATANSDATSQILVDSKGINITPGSGTGSLTVALSRNGTEIISGELNITGGKITFGYDNAVTFAKDTSWDFTWNGYTMTATTTDEATIEVSLTGNGISFTPGQNDGGVSLVLRRNGTPVFGGVLNVSDGTITFDSTTQKFSFTEGTNISLALPGNTPRLVDFKVVNGNASVKVEAGTDGKFILTPDNNDGALQISVSRDGATVFQNTFNVSGGSIVFDPATNSVGLTQGTTLSLGLNNYTIAATATDDANFGLGLLNDGRIAITPQDNDGSLDIAIKRDGTTIFQNRVSVSDGSIIVNPETLAMTLTKGTNISLSFGNYELNATTTADATVGIAVMESGIALTPQANDGSLNLTINNAGGSMNANVEVVSGSFILGEGGKLTVAKDTELKIDFGDGYIVNFKATDDAGGSLVLGKDGITFAPNEGDGGLELSVTRNGQTRTASLDVTGSITYKLDGSISIAKGTVITNKFESGRTLTITANTDASGSIIFSPEGGLTITPATSDALTLQVINGANYWFFDEITGSITYSRDKIVLADDTTFKGVVAYEDGTHILGGFSFGSEGGETTLKFGSYIIEATPASGAATTLNNSATGHGWKLSSGSITLDASNNTMIYKLIAGSEIVGDIPGVSYRLTETGNYTLNGMNIATTKDNVQVLLTNYDTVTFEADAGVVFDGQEFSGDGLITLTNGGIVIVNSEDNVAVNGTASNDRITNIGDNVTISALGGNDTINSDGNGVKIDGGAGSNLVSLFGGDEGSEIVFDGVTTVEGFKTGWGSGSDTVYLNTGSDPAVDFKSIGLTFYDGSDSLTLDDVDETAKVHLYYEEIDWLRKGVFIARNDWYQVSDSDLTVDSGEGIYFVGTSATHNHGVDFSGVSQALNVSMNTDYDAANNSIWVNNVYSIRGGAGNTTITGTDDSDTIIAGTGRTTINGAGGNDRISLSGAAALVNYTAGGGNDSVYGFNANSTISIGGAAYSSATSGNNLVLSVGSDNVTLFGAASLDNPHILGTTSGGGGSSSGGGSNSSTSGGGSNATTSGGGSSSTDDSSKSLFGAEDMYSIGTGGKLVTTPPNSSSGTPYTGSKDRGVTVNKPTVTRTSSLSGSSIQEIWRAMVGITNVTASTTAASSDTASTLAASGDAASAIAYVYAGGDMVISNYTSGEKIALGTPPTSGTFIDGHFVLSSASGNLIVENATDKVIDFTDGAGNDYLKAYEASSAGTIDGRGIAGYKIINGANYEPNEIRAGDGGSQLWGGAYSSDELHGGAGADVFIAGVGCGHDNIFGADEKDTINLAATTLDQISSVYVAGGGIESDIMMNFTDGSSLVVWGFPDQTVNFKLADGSAYSHINATDTWVNTN